MAIVRYHGLGASNLGKVRPAPYKYADPTDINNATTFPVYAKPGTTFGDLFYGDGAPEFGMSGKQLRTWHNQKERRDAANTAAGFYTPYRTIYTWATAAHCTVQAHKVRIRVCGRNAQDTVYCTAHSW